MEYKIKCPHCQAEYLPAEIFLPNSLLGKPREIEKDANGQIIQYLGTNMDPIESYRCDFCNRKFNVEMSVKFFTNSKVKNFEATTSTQINKPSLFLDED